VSPPFLQDLAEVLQEESAAAAAADLDIVKHLLKECAERNDFAKNGSEQSEEFFAAIDKFFEYVDTHPLEASELAALREWLVLAIENTDDGKSLTHDTLPAKIRFALLRVYELRDEYEPRHVILAVLLGNVPSSFPQLRGYAFHVRQKRREGGKEGILEESLARFLEEKSHAALYNGILAEADAMESLNGPGHFDADHLVDALLATRQKPQEFEKNLVNVLRLCDELMKALPAYAYSERFRQTVRLRAVWNIVHAYGDEADQTLITKFVVDLIERYKAKGDAPTMKWLEQVMAEPGKPVDQYVYTIEVSLPEAK
jgi:hypothetical protein